MLCSSNAAGLRGLKVADIGGSDEPSLRWFRYIASTTGLDATCIRNAKSIGIQVMETVHGSERGWEEETLDNVGRDLGREEGRVPGFVPSARRGSFVRGVLERCEQRGTAVGGVVQFVHEGDNRGDARVLAGVVGRLLEVRKGESEGGGWMVPKAWEEVEELPNGLY